MDGGTSHARAEALNSAFVAPSERSGAGRGRGRGRSSLSARGRGRANVRGGGRAGKTWTTSDGLISKGPGQVRTQARPNGFLERRQRLWVGALEQRAGAGLGGFVVTEETERVSERATYSVSFLRAASEEWRKDPSWLGDPVAFRTRLEQTIGRDSDQPPVRRSEATDPAPVTDIVEDGELFWDDSDGDQPDVAAAEALQAQADAAKEREAAELLERQRREQAEAEERQQQAERIAQVAERRRQQLVALQQATVAASKWGDLDSLAAAIAKAEDDGVDATALSQARRTEAALISRRKKQIEKEEEEARQLAEDTARQLAKQAEDEKRRAQAEAKAMVRQRVLAEKEAARQAEEAAAREAQEAKWAAEVEKRAADEAARKRLADTLRSEAAQARRDLQEQEESLRKQQEEERQARKREREAAAAAAAKANVWGSVQSNAASAGASSAFPALGRDAPRPEPQSSAGEDDGLWWDSLEDSSPQKPAAPTAAEVAAKAAMKERQAMLAAAKKKTEAAEAKWRRMEEERVTFEQAEEARVRAAVAARKQELEEKRARDLAEMRRLQAEREEAKAKSAALWSAKYQAIVAEDSGRGGGPGGGTGTAAASAAGTATAPLDAAFPSLGKTVGAGPDFVPASTGAGRGRGRGRGSGRPAVAASSTLAPAPTPQATFFDDDDDSDDAFEDAVQDEQSWQQRINAEKQAAVERSKAEQAAKRHADAMQARQAAEREAALRTAEEERELFRQEAEARAGRAKEAFERRQRELAELSAQREEAAAESRSAAASTWANQYEALSRKDTDGSGLATRPKAAWGKPAAAQPAASENDDDAFPSLGSEAFPSLGPAPNAGNPRGSNLLAEKFGLEAKRSRAERKKERERLAAAEAVEEAKAAAAKAAADKRAAAAEVERQVAREQAEAEAAVVRMREAEQLQADRARLQAQKTAAVASTWAAKYEAVSTAKDETEFPGLPTTDVGSRKTGWGRTGAAAGTGQPAADDQSAAPSGAAAFPLLGEAFPSLPAPAPVAPRSRGAGRDSGSAANGGYSVAMGRKGRQAKGLSSTQRKKAKKKRIAAGEWTKLEKVRCLCENNSGCTIRARFPEDGRWYDATLDMHVGNQYKVTYTDYDDSGLLGLDDLQIDEAWLSFEYSTGYVAPRIHGESDEDDDEGYDTADDDTEEQGLDEDNANGEGRIAGNSEQVGHHTTDSDSTNDAQSVLVVGTKGARDRAARAKKAGISSASSEQQDPKPVSEPVPEPEPPKTVYSPTAAAAALNTFLSSIGGQCMMRASLFGLNFQRFESTATHVY